MFVELAVASSSRCLVTRNVRDFTVNTDLNLSHLKIVTPTQFMAEWRETHGREA